MRPEFLEPLFAELTTLPGVGPRNAKLFEKIAGGRVRDLAYLAPSGLVQRQTVATVQGVGLGEIVTVEVEVVAHRAPPPASPRPYRVTVRDAEIDFQLIYFRAQQDYMHKLLPVGERRVVSGKIDHFDGVAQIAHPDHVLAPEDEDRPPETEPVYPLTAGLSLRVVGKAVRAAVALSPELAEWLDPALLAREGWPDWRTAMSTLHAPSRPADLEATAPARTRLAYDELLAHQLALGLARLHRRAKPGLATHGDGSVRAKLTAALPFQFTGAQARVIGEIAEDMRAPERMMRLLQGDVGAGKTLVALFAMAIAIEAGGQAALMAPTEILARQHAAGLRPWGEAAGVRMASLSGRDRGKARAALLEDLKEGRIDILFGTHALFQEDVAFHDLRLAVIDEQHRFGVAQRMALADKGRDAAADVLLMSATPIPRSLALASFGDLDLSILDEKPPGRKPIDTRLMPIERYDEVVAAIARKIAEGGRAYWVCPLVEESEAQDLAAAEDRARALAHRLGPERVALVHGRMAAADKDAAMARFVAGEAQVLVATTVIEVGVDVKEASVIVIEQAERFGLAQLHQLRGRVGRGATASHCLLLYQSPLTKAGQARLQALRESEDGFFLAEEDLRLRGAGDLLGVKQSGLPAYRIADLETQGGLAAMADDDARLVLTRDPTLTSERGQALRVLLHLLERDAAIRFLSAG